MNWLYFYKIDNNPFDFEKETPVSLNASRKKVCQQMLSDLVDGYSPVLLTGESGSGKTLFLKQLTRLLPSDIHLIIPFTSHMGFVDRAEMSISSQSALIQRAKKILLVVDNAQDIEPDDLNALLDFPNKEKFAGKQFQMIWIGTPALEAKLNIINANKFNTFYPNHFRLAGFSEEEVKQHIDSCLQAANYPVKSQGELFSTAAIRDITRLAKGLPGLVNILCSNSLALAFLDGEAQVSEQRVQEVYLLGFLANETDAANSAHTYLLSPEKLMEIIPEKFNIKYLKRCLRLYFSKLPWFNQGSLGDFFASLPSKIVIGGALAVSLCLMILLSFISSDKEESTNALVANHETEIKPSIESSTVSHSPPAAVLNETEKAAKMQLDEVKPSLQQAVVLTEAPKPSFAPEQHSPPATVLNNAAEASHAQLDEVKPSSELEPPAASPQQTEAVTEAPKASVEAEPNSLAVPVVSSVAKAANPQVDTVKPSPTVEVAVSPQVTEPTKTTVEAVASEVPAVAKTSVIAPELKVLSAGIKSAPALNSKPQGTKQASRSHKSGNLSHVPQHQSAKTEAEHKAIKQAPPVVQAKSAKEKAAPKPEFVLKPLDDPGKWDEIVILDDPKDPKNSVQTPLTASPEAKPEAKMAEEPAQTVPAKAKGSRKQKDKYVLKPLDAPGQYDEIVIVDEPESKAAQTDKPAASAPKVPAANPSKEVLKLDKSNYQFLDQIIIVDDEVPNAKANKPKKAQQQ